MRVDEAVEKHCKYLEGKTSIGPCKMLEEEEEKNKTNNTMSNEEFDRSNETLPSTIGSSSSIDETAINCHAIHSDDSDNSDKENCDINNLLAKIVKKTAECDSGVNCPACKDKNTPAGAHKCAKCSRAVHALSQSSGPKTEGEETEGYRQRRICLSCCSKDIPESTRVIAGNQVENWGGLALNNKN